MFSWDFNAATLTAIVVNVVLVIVFLVKTHGKAVSAYELAAATQKRHDILEERLRKVEAEHVLGMATRADFQRFQDSIGNQLTALRQERRDDMRGLHERLNDILMVPPRSTGAE